MKVLITSIAILFSFSNLLIGQTRTLYGHVIDAEDLGPLPLVLIETGANQIIGKTDFNGSFKIDVPQSTQSLSLISVGYEQATIKLAADCDTIEIVMMESGSYDFMSARKINKDRLKRFNKLTEVYLKAYETGIFRKASVCYTREFEPWKPSLHSKTKAY